jgi:hypothetical protein
MLIHFFHSRANRSICHGAQGDVVPDYSVDADTLLAPVVIGAAGRVGNDNRGSTIT